MYNKTLLINENGDEFIGWSIDNFNPATGELIFNTAMTGFVEIPVSYTHLTLPTTAYV